MSDRCHIIRDMLPLYLDGMLSEDSVGFVEEHLQGCGACREELEKLKAPDDFPRETPERDAAALKAMKRKWNRRVVLLGILLACALLAAVVGALFVGVGAGLSVRAGGASGGDDALAMCIAHVTGMGIQWAYLSTDLVVLGLSLTYIPLRRIGYSLLTVLISGQLIGLVQRLPLPWDKPRPEAAE